MESCCPRVASWPVTGCAPALPLPLLCRAPGARDRCSTQVHVPAATATACCSDALLEEEEQQPSPVQQQQLQQQQHDQAPQAKRQHTQAPDQQQPPQGRLPAQAMHRREPSLAMLLPGAQQQQGFAVPAGGSLGFSSGGVASSTGAASSGSLGHLLQQQHIGASPGAPASLGGSVGDPLLLAAKCLPQLHQLQQQQQQGQLPSVEAPGASFAFQSPFTHQQAEVAGLSSAFGHAAAAAAAADFGPASGHAGGAPSQQDPQMLLLHQALSIGPAQHSTTLTDG